MESVVPLPTLIAERMIWIGWSGFGENAGFPKTSGIVVTWMSWEKLLEVQGDWTANSQLGRSLVPTGLICGFPVSEERRIAGEAFSAVTVRLKKTWEPGQKFL